MLKELRQKSEQLDAANKKKDEQLRVAQMRAPRRPVDKEQTKVAKDSKDSQESKDGAKEKDTTAPRTPGSLKVTVKPSTASRSQRELELARKVRQLEALVTKLRDDNKRLSGSGGAPAATSSSGSESKRAPPSLSTTQPDAAQTAGAGQPVQAHAQAKTSGIAEPLAQAPAQPRIAQPFERWETEKKLQKRVDELKKKCDDRGREQKKLNAELEELRKKCDKCEKERAELAGRLNPAQQSLGENPGCDSALLLCLTPKLCSELGTIVVSAAEYERAQTLEDAREQLFQSQQEVARLQKVIDVEKQQTITRLQDVNRRLAQQLERAEKEKGSEPREKSAARKGLSVHTHYDTHLAMMNSGRRTARQAAEESRRVGGPSSGAERREPVTQVRTTGQRHQHRSLQEACARPYPGTR